MQHFRLRGNIEGHRLSLPLTAGENLAGHHPDNDLVIAASGVSRRHAAIELREEGILLRDLDSKNGTMVNGRRQRVAVLRPGDVIEIGQARLRLEAVAAEDAELGLTLETSPAPEASWVPPRETTEIFGRHGDGVPGGLVFPPGYVIGRSPAMRSLYAQMQPLVQGDLPVLILGDTGVGKEFLATILHLSSRRRDGPFVAINCAAIPADLLESELFGIERGVATGVSARAGKFHQARGGTVFLDEIGDMSAELQAKLLRALQEKEIQPVGGKAITTDVRVVAATNTDLKARIEAGAFRRDLYYRLAGATLPVPTLAQRREDVPALAEHFLRAAAREAGKSIRGVTVKALRTLQDHPWPGNVRELEHEVGRLVYLCGNSQAIDSSMLSPEILEGAAGRSRDGAPRPVSVGERSGSASTPTGDAVPPEAASFNLAELEKQAIERALTATGGVQVQAARLLGISRDALRRRIERYGLSAHKARD